MLVNKIKKVIEKLYLKNKLKLVVYLLDKEYQAQYDFEESLREDNITIKLTGSEIEKGYEKIKVKDIIAVKNNGILSLEIYNKEHFAVRSYAELSIYEIKRINILDNLK